MYNPYEETVLGTPRGVAGWRNLETLGDCRRLIAWTIHSFREKRLDAREANTFGQLANILLSAIKEADIETRIEALERALAQQQHPSQNGAPRVY